MTQIVLTGAYALTSVGHGRAAFFEALCRGISGVTRLAYFDHARFTKHFAYEIAGDRDAAFRTSRLLVCAARCASAEAGLHGRRGSDRIAIIVGTGLRELGTLERWDRGEAEMRVDELHFGGALERALGFDAPVLTLCNACAASNGALAIADDLLQLDEADIVIVAGCDTLTESMFGLLDRVTSTTVTELRPFDRTRKGVLMGDGAAAVVVETAAHAARRQQGTLATLRGVGMSCDAFNATAPDRDGIVRAMRDAHRRAGITPDEVDLVMAHGTGTAQNDTVEAGALKAVFGNRPRVAITGLKSMIGHTSGASALVAVVASIEAMAQSRIPPTLYLDDPMDEAKGLDIVTGTARRTPIRIAQVNAFGFGGVNAVAILGSGAAAAA